MQTSQTTLAPVAMKKFRYRLTLTIDGDEEGLQGILGSQASREIATNYALKKAQEKGFPAKELPGDEMSALTPAEEMENKTTVFHKVDDCPVLFNYQLKGFLKEAANAQKEQIKLTWPASRVAQGLFIKERTLFMFRPDGNKITKAEIDLYERPLRAMTMQGPRVGIAVSEWIKPPIVIKCELHLIGDKLDEDTIHLILQYGEYVGLGQFRSGGFGSFLYELEPLQETKPTPIDKVKRGRNAAAKAEQNGADKEIQELTA